VEFHPTFLDRLFGTGPGIDQAASTGQES
jgi:hypothetical protein